MNMIQTKWMFAVLALAAMGSPGYAAPTGFGIDSPEAYGRFVEAVRASEYVRESFLVGGDLLGPDCQGGGVEAVPPRAIATVAAGIAFHERNPLASTDDLIVFMSAADEMFAEVFPTDPGLRVPEHLLAALQYRRLVTGVSGQAASEQLMGYDTDVGDRAIELLGVELPQVFGVDSLAERVRAVEAASGMNLVTSSEFGLMLVRVYMGSQAGEGGADLAAAVDSYLLCRGVDSGIGSIRSDMPGVNAALSGLPSFAEVQAALSQPALPIDPAVCDPGDEDPRACVAANLLQENLRRAVYDALDVGGDIIDDFAAPATLEQSIALTPAEIQQIEADRIADLRRSSAARASMLLHAGLLYDNTDAAPYVEQQLDLGSAVLGANTHWANVKSGIETYLGFVGAGVALAQGDAAGWAAGVSDSIISVFGILETNVSAGVTTDDIFEQVQEMRQQLQDVQTQLNERFDAVDAKLDVIFDTMVDSFDLVLGDLANIDASVDQATALILEQTSAINRLEDTLGTFARDQLSVDFKNDVNTYLTARGVDDLAYNGATPSFRQGATDYFTYGADLSTGSAFVGDGGSPFALSDAEAALDGDAVSTRLAELIVNAGAFTAVPGFDESGIAGPEPWTAGATAYAELVGQSPWYFSLLNDVQQATLPRTHVDTFIDRGERLLGFVDWCRGAGDFGLVDHAGTPVEESHLIAGLIGYYDSAAQGLQDAIEAQAAETLSSVPAGSVFDYSLSRPDGSYLDLWPADAFADPGDFGPSLTKITTGWGNSSNDLNFGSNPPAYSGFAMFAPRSTIGPPTDDQRTISALLRTKMIAATVPSDGVSELPEVHWYMTQRSLNGDRWTMNIVVSGVPGEAAASGFLARREIDFVHEYFREGGLFSEDEWRRNNFQTPTVPAELMQIAWPMVLRERFAAGSRIPIGVNYEYTNNQGSQVRTRFLSDNVVLGENRPTMEAEVLAWYHMLRSTVRADVIDGFLDTGSAIEQAARSLDDAESLLDAYASVAFSGVFERSQLVRSALRGAPPSAADGYGGSAFGIRAADAFELLLRFGEADGDPGMPGDRAFDFAAIASDNLHERSDAIRHALARELSEPAQTSPAVLWTLESLRAMRDHASRLAVDDAYESHAEGEVRSVLENDTRQLFNVIPDGDGVVFNDRPIEVDVAFTHEPGGSLRTGLGRVTIFTDGTFAYVPDPGAEGIDVFAYRTRCDVGVVDQASGETVYAYSDPAYVRVRIEPSPCAADVAPPFGVLDIDDVLTFLNAFATGSAVADVAAPSGVLDIDDVLTFLNAFAVGCP